MIYFETGLALVVGFLVGALYGSERRPLGNSALAVECDDQKARAQAAEKRIEAIRKALQTL